MGVCDGAMYTNEEDGGEFGGEVVRQSQQPQTRDRGTNATSALQTQTQTQTAGIASPYTEHRYKKLFTYPDGRKCRGSNHT